MAGNAIGVEVKSVSAGKLTAFWVLLIANIVLLSIYWFSGSSGNLAGVLIRVFFGAIFVPGTFVILSQLAKSSRNNVARIDIFTMVSAFVFCISAVTIYTRFFI